MTAESLPSIGILFAQFAAYHVDRCEAVAVRLAGRWRVTAVEVATTSATYAWEASGEVAGARKVTLFPGRSFDALGAWERLWAQYRALRQCRFVLVGLSYAETSTILLTWMLRLSGVRPVVLSESKFDDVPRNWLRESLKAITLGVYCGAIVGGRRHVNYFRFLGFRGRPVLPGYDGVGIDRIRRLAEGITAPAWETRPFVFVGRFVDKKNLPQLIRAYALYRQGAGAQARQLVLIGDGEERAKLQALAESLGVGEGVEWPGFLPADQVGRRIAGALALCLVSAEEQWGLVVNEALAVNLPVIVSNAVGSRDALVRNGLNGFVVDQHDELQIAHAMTQLAGDREIWDEMSKCSAERAWLGDVGRFADAVEYLCDPTADAAGKRINRFRAETGS